MTIDPILLEVIANRLDEIQQVMKHRLFHTGYSTILRESFDGSAGLTTPDGRLIGASGMTTHTGPYAKMVEAIVAKYGRDIHPGDAFISNDPYRSGSAHTPDVATAAPVFVDGELVAFCTSLGHKPDVGGIAPSSSSAASRSIYHEGLLLPPVKLVDKGIWNEGVRSIIENNSRTPELLMGDIAGQVGCTRIGGELVEQLCRQYGTASIREAIEVLLQTSEKRLRHELAALPDGEAEAENWLDGDGVSGKPIRIHVKLSKRADSIVLDFSGSDKQTAGPANAVVQVVRSVAAGAVVAFIDHTVTYNDGVFKTIEMICPAGTVIHPQSPAPVNSYMPASHLVFNIVTAALCKLYPEKAVAESGLGVGALAFSYESAKTGKTTVQYEISQTGLGATTQVDGASITHPIMIHETVQPIEIIESEFPVLIRNFGIRTDSAGAGMHRGGIGYVKEYEMREPSHFMSRLSQRRFGAHGAAGGGAPERSHATYNPGRPNERILQGLDQVAMQAGDVLRIEQSGGAGLGDPAHRDPDKLLDDIADGYVSIEAAERHYGYIVRQDSDGHYRITGRAACQAVEPEHST
jgi:N-methylhydantoinase B